MNARATVAANSGNGISGDIRPNPEAGGSFHTLLTTASQDSPESEALKDRPAVIKHGAGAGGAVRKPVRQANDTAGVEMAFAAAMIAPPLKLIPISNIDLKELNAEVLTSTDAAGWGQRVAVPGGVNHGIGQVPSSPAIRPAAFSGPMFDQQGIWSAAEIFDSGAEAMGYKDAGKGVPAEDFAPVVETTATANALPPAILRSDARAEGQAVAAARSGPPHKSQDPVNEKEEREQTGMAAEVGANTPELLSNSALGKRETISAQIAAVADPGRQVPSTGSASSGQKTDPEANGEAEATSEGLRIEKPAAANSSHATLVMESRVEDRHSREPRGSRSADDADGADARDDLPSTMPGTPSSQSLSQESTEVAGARAPHPTPALSPSRMESPHAAVSSQLDAATAPLAPTLQTAQVLQRMNKAEIRIGLQTTDFGAVRLHTTVANDQVGAAVSASHPGLHDALLVEAPSLERAMVRHSLHLAGVSVDAGSGHSAFNNFGSNERQESPATRANASWPVARKQRSESAPLTMPVSLPANDRLDVRA